MFDETETLQVFRGGNDNKGNPNRAAHGTVEAIFAWGQAGETGRYSSTNNFKGEANSFTAQIFVARGTDLKNRDRVKRVNGDEFRVIGGASWDQNFPMDGFDFEYVMFQLESM